MLRPSLQLRVAQKQILTPGLVQMVTVLQLNRLELKEMITQEIVENPVLEESTEEAGEEITAEELLPLLEPERVTDPSDQQLLEATMGDAAHTNGIAGEAPAELFAEPFQEAVDTGAAASPEVSTANPVEPVAATDPFDEIDFGSFFDDYLDPGYKSPASESVEKPSFETFLSAPITLGDHLHSQLSVSVLSDDIRDAAESIIGNLDEDGYLTASAGGDRRHGRAHAGGNRGGAESGAVARSGGRGRAQCAGVPAAGTGEHATGAAAWPGRSSPTTCGCSKCASISELAKVLGRPMEHIEIAVKVIRRLNPRPGLRYSGAGARTVEPDVFFIKDGDDYIIQMNDEDVPQLRLNAQYRRCSTATTGPPKKCATTSASATRRPSS